MKEILIAGVIALVFSFFGTPALIKLLARHGYGQMIRDDGPQSHHTKRGTPTIGGVAIIASATTGYFVSHIVDGVGISVSALLVLGLVFALGIVGFVDDWIKIVKQRSLGLTSKQKLAGQSLAAIGFARIEVAGPNIGDAAAVKMIRSVMVKGIEALTAECILAANRAGVTDAVIASLDASTKARGWGERADYNFDRMLAHGTRRAAEMEEVARTLEDLGIAPAMTRATMSALPPGGKGTTSFTALCG